MKAAKIVYWVSTSIVALMMVFAGYSYLTNSDIKRAFIHLGFPGYFRIELAVAKIIGAAVLILPLNAKIKEWAYAGFTIVFVSAVIAHIASGDPATVYITPVIFLVVLIVSYLTYTKFIVNSTAKNITTVNLA